MSSVPLVDRFYRGNLTVVDGKILAGWRLTTPQPRPATEDEADQVVAVHHELFRAISGCRFWLEGVLVWTDTAALIDGMIGDTDLAVHPDWADACEAAIDLFEQQALARREFFLTVQLPLGRLPEYRLGALEAVNNILEEWCSMSPLPPSDRVLAAADAVAARIGERLPAELGAVPMTPAEAIWLRRHAQNPQTASLVNPVENPEGADLLLTGAAGAGLVWVDPYEVSKATSPQAKTIAPVRNRYVHLVDDQGWETYTSHLVLSKIPISLAWPTTEFLGRLDGTGVPLDIVMTGVVRSQHDATSKNKWSANQLADQVNQVADEGGIVPGEHNLRLGQAAQNLTDYQSALASDQTLVEVEPVILVRMSSPSPVDAEGIIGVETLVEQFQNAEVNRAFTWARPVGAEEDMYWAAQRGGVPSRPVASYRQVSHSATVASTAMVTSHRLGDDSGIPVAINETTALPSVVSLEFFGRGASRKKKSPSIVTVGDQGGGKSYAAKAFASALVARGARLIATDTSVEAEWVRFAHSLGTSVSVIDFADPVMSADPLRCLPPKMAGPAMQSFLITLLGIEAASAEGKLLAKMLKPRYLREHALTSAGALQAHLASSDEKGAKDLADRIGVFSDLEATDGYAAPIFDPGLPAADLGTQVMIWRTSNLELPSDEELASPHLFKTLSVEKIFGRAAYALFARFAHEVCMADSDEEALMNIDEFHTITTSPESMKAAMDFLRMGRHNLGGFAAQSQLCSDYPADMLRLIRTKIVLRLSNIDAAREAAALLGRPAGDDKYPAETEAHEALARRILDHNAPGEGAGVMCDHRGQIGDVQMLPPLNPAVRAAADTADQMMEA